MISRNHEKVLDYEGQMKVNTIACRVYAVTNCYFAKLKQCMSQSQLQKLMSTGMVIMLIVVRPVE